MKMRCDKWAQYIGSTIDYVTASYYILSLWSHTISHNHQTHTPLLYMHEKKDLNECQMNDM